MQKIILQLIILVFIFPFILLAQETDMNQNPLQKVQDYFNPNKGLEAKIITGDNYIAKLNWNSKDSGGFDFQLIYSDGVSYILKPDAGNVDISFLDKDGYEVFNSGSQMCCDYNNFNIEDKFKAILRNYFSCSKEEYRKITSISIKWRNNRPATYEITPKSGNKYSVISFDGNTPTDEKLAEVGVPVDQ